MMQFRDLEEQYRHLRRDIDQTVAGVLASGSYIGGEQVRALEQELAAYVGAEHCITCANGTDALQLALMAWGIGEGDAVFVPDFTFFSSGEVVSAVGAMPVFVDVDARMFDIDPVKLEEAVRAVEREGRFIPRAVVAVDLFGLPADYPAIREVCASHQLHLLEDGAQGFGGSIGGERACSFGDISTTSFFPAKPLGCYGDGGAVFTDSDELASLIRSLAVHGKGSMKYDNVRIGMNSRLDALQAAILRVKLEAFEGCELEQVNEAATRYTELLAGTADAAGIALPAVPAGYRSSWAQYTLKMASFDQRERIRSALADQGIPTMVYYPKPMHEQLAFRDACIVPPEGCPVTGQLCSTVLSLPMGPYLGEGDIRAVAHALEKIAAV